MGWWGLTLSVRKTKLLAAAALGTEDGLRPTVLDGGEVECDTNSKNLGNPSAGSKWWSRRGDRGENC